MTHAVCVMCGAMKFGAFVPCPACGQASGARDLQDASLFWSDHVFDLDDLRDISAHVIAHRAFPEVRKEDGEEDGPARWVLLRPPRPAEP